MKTLYGNIFYPLVFALVVFLVHVLRLYFLEFPIYGIEPRTIEALYYVPLGAFYHASWSHLGSNLLPLFFLGTLLFTFYPSVALKILFWIYLGGSFWLWSFGRSGVHIGASGVIYGLFGFLSFSGLIRKNKSLLAISFLTLFIYGSMIWGVFPLEVQVSWEGHFVGLLWGVILSFFYKKQGPDNVLYPLNDDDSLNEFRYGAGYWKNDLENQETTPGLNKNQETEVEDN